MHRTMNLTTYYGLPAALLVLAAAPRHAYAQSAPAISWKGPVVAHDCPKADSRFGHMWRSQGYRVLAVHSSRLRATVLRTVPRSTPFKKGKTRVTSIDGFINVLDSGQSTDPVLELQVSFLDSILRRQDEVLLSLRVDDHITLAVDPPKLYTPLAPNVTEGVPLVAGVILSPRESQVLAGARKVTGTVAGYPFFFYDWELHDLNTLYRAALCGTSLGT